MQEGKKFLVFIFLMYIRMTIHQNTGSIQRLQINGYKNNLIQYFVSRSFFYFNVLSFYLFYFFVFYLFTIFLIFDFWFTVFL